MFKLFFRFLALVIILVSVYVVFNSQRTFEVKFSNIDGLPIGAPITAQGVKVGKVIKTRPSSDGIIVTVRITNKHLKKIQGGSELAITSFSPNQGRILEIVPPYGELSDKKGFIVQEPITTESWLHASIELVEGLKTFSGLVIKHVTPENFQKARIALERASESLIETTINLSKHKNTLVEINETFASKANEANELLARLHKPIESLNKILNDKNFQTSFKDELKKLSSDSFKISSTIINENYVSDLKSFKTMILDYLNNINNSLIEMDSRIEDFELKQKIKDFNRNLASLNDFYSMIKQEDVHQISNIIKKARDATTKTKEMTDKLVVERQ